MNRIPENIRLVAERSLKHARSGQSLKLLSAFVLGIDQDVVTAEELKVLKAEKAMADKKAKEESLKKKKATTAKQKTKKKKSKKKKK